MRCAMEIEHNSQKSFKEKEELFEALYPTEDLMDDFIEKKKLKKEFLQYCANRLEEFLQDIKILEDSINDTRE